MSSMTGIQLAAMRAAQRGSWELADAIEVLHRVEQGSALFGVRLGRRLAAFVYSDADVSLYDDCAVCNGCGYVCDADGFRTKEKCVSCGDTFQTARTAEALLEEAEDAYAETLNGDALDIEELPMRPGGVITHEQAQKIVAEYRASLAVPPDQPPMLPLTQAA